MNGTSAQLRHNIDSGRTGDKVAFPDPAMAPLGTDEEAGGNPTSPENIHRAVERETVRDRPKESRTGSVVIVLSILGTFVATIGSVFFFTG